MDIETSANIQYGQVDAIVQAIKTRRLVKRLPPSYGDGMSAPTVDARSISQVWHHEQDQSPYTVRFRRSNIAAS